MRLDRRNAARVAAGATLLALLLTACGGESDAGNRDSAGDTSAASETTASEPDETEPEDAPDEPAEPPFDPNSEIRPADIVVRAMGDSEDTRPWEHAMLPDEFVLPGTAKMVTWAPPEEPFSGGQHSGSAAFRLFESDADTVADFFLSRMENQGWDLERENFDSNGAWELSWAIVQRWDGWDEDWQADERGINTTVRVVYIPRDGAATLQFYYGARETTHNWNS